MNIPKISVIVPIYNVEQYLDRCIKSVINQTYKNLEIILVDDGSPDKCPQICDAWPKKDSRIIVIHKPNGGLSDARNSGLDEATGDFISFVDSDDFVTEDFLETLYDMCRKYECDIAQCDFIRVYDDNIISAAQDDNIQIFSNIQMLYNIYNKLYHQTIIAPNKLYKKHLFENMRYPVGKYHEDEALTYKIIYNAEKIAVSNKKMYMYYQNGNSIIRSKYNLKRLDRLEIYEERVEFFDDRGLWELREKTMERYCISIIVEAIHCRNHIAGSKDVQKKLMNKYRRAYKKVLFQKSTSIFVKIKVILYRCMPRLLAWTGKIR